MSLFYYTLDLKKTSSLIDIDVWAYNIESDSPIDLLAYDIAQDLWDNHDGFMLTWPLVVYVFNTKELLGTYNINLDMQPEFTISKLNPQKNPD